MSPGNVYKIILIAALSAAIFGCRGQRSSKPPIHLIQNMDTQEKFRAFGENSFFADGRNMRELVAGTVPRGFLNEDDGYHTGKVVVEVTRKIRRRRDTTYLDTQYVSNPLAIDMMLLKRGQDRYTIFCSMCHGASGDGKGIVVQKGFTPAPPYSDPRLMALEDGAVFEVITDGIRTMPSMKGQIPVADRWAVAAYVKALQRSVKGTMNDVPPDKRGELN